MDELAQRQQRKQHIVEVRRAFFERLLGEWSRPPEAIDEVLGQSSYFIPPDQGEGSVLINDPERGLLMQSFSPPEAWGKRIQFLYSIWMAGDWIRYGVLVHGDPRLLSTFAQKNVCVEALERVWDKQATHMSREGGLLMEWRFDDLGFYDDYLLEDRYLQVARHLHFQLGTSIHEAFAEAAFASPDDDSNLFGQPDE